MTLEGFLEAAEARRLDGILQVDWPWQGFRLLRGGLRPAEPRLGAEPPHRPFGLDGLWLARAGLGLASGWERCLGERAPSRGGGARRSLLLGRLAAALGRWQEALPLLRAAASGRRCPQGSMSLGESLLYCGDAAGAFRAFARAAACDSAQAWAWAWRAEAMKALGDADGAVKAIRRAREIAPGEPGLLVLEARLGRADALDEALEATPACFWALVHRAWRRLGAGGHEASRQDLDRALDVEPGSAWALLWRAQAKEGAGDIKGAERDREAAIERTPAAIWGYSRRARARGWIAAPAEVIAECEERLAADPEDAVAYALRGESRDQHGLVVADLERARSLQPGRAWVSALLARVRLYQGLTREALAHIDAAIALNPRCGWFRSWRGEILRRSGELAEAVREQSRALLLCPHDARAYAWRGSLKRLSGDLPGALADLDAGLELDASYAWALNERRLVLADLRQAKASLMDFARAASRDGRIAASAGVEERRALGGAPGPPSARSLALIWRAERELRRGSPARALRRIEGALRLDPWSGWSYALRAEIRLRRGRTAAAVEDLERFLGLSVKDCGASLLLARLLRRGGELEKARGLLDRALRLDPDDPWAYQERALCRLAQGEATGAYQDQRQAQRRETGRPWIYGAGHLVLRRGDDRLGEAITELSLPGRGGYWPRVWRGYLRWLSGNPQAARRDLLAGLRFEPRGAWAMAWLGEMELSRGKVTEAARWLGSALRLEPDCGWMLGLWGEILSALGREEQAEGALARAIELDPDLSRARLCRARLREFRGLPEQAAAELDWVLGLEPRAAPLWCWRGRLHLRLGRWVEAESDFSRAAGLHQGDGEARRGIEEARRRMRTAG